MPTTDFRQFETELCRLSAKFEKEFKTVVDVGYSEARLRQDYLDPLFRALGWDLENHAGLIQTQREVEIESRTDIEGRAKRADYLFRTDARDRFVCEAKKPREELGPRYAFQAKRYGWNKNLPLALLSDFEELKIYIVGGKPHLDRPEEGLWKSWHYKQFPLVAEEIWNLLAREKVAAGSIEALLDSLPKRAPTGRSKARQLYLIKPDRSRALDTDFLNFLDEARRELASSILKHNDRADVLEGTRLNEAVQHILDRILFVRICEDRDIDTGTRLESIVETWRRSYDRTEGQRHKQTHLLDEPPAIGYGRNNLPRESLWFAIVRHFRALDRRPPSHVPFFNGQLFKQHFSEDLLVGDAWLADFIGQLSDDESPYLFNIIPVEILGSVYERFLGKVVRPQGRGVTIEEKPEVRKAGGVYYTPRYIVDYIVEQTVGKIVGEFTEGAPKFPTLEKKTRAVRILDPACGSGSFLIRAFERVCEHWLAWFTAHPEDRKKKLCWVEEVTGDVHLTVDLKRQILRDNIYGVDLDPQAVEVTQLSLYLKMLEGETRQTLARERDIFGSDIALLPPLDANIKCGNSLIASDFSMIAEDLVRVRAFDWPIQFREIMKAGGFDAVIGNPPYIRIQTMQESDATTVRFFKEEYMAAARGNYDIYVLFVERSLALLALGGISGFILPNKFLNAEYGAPIRSLLSAGSHLHEIVHFGANQVFDGATTYTCLLFLTKAPSTSLTFRKVDELDAWSTKRTAQSAEIATGQLSGAPWSFSVGAGAELVERLKLLPVKLGEAADIFVGLQTSADDVFIMDFVSETSRLLTLHSKVAGTEVTLEKGLLHPLISGRDVQGYDALPNRQFILFPYNVEDENAALLDWKAIENKYPRTASYLTSQRSRLAGREKGKFRDSQWYRFGRSQNLGIQSRQKLCVPRLVDRLCATGDLTGSHFLDNVDVGGVTLKARL